MKRLVFEGKNVVKFETNRKKEKNESHLVVQYNLTVAAQKSINTPLR